MEKRPGVRHLIRFIVPNSGTTFFGFTKISTIFEIHQFFRFFFHVPLLFTKMDVTIKGLPDPVSSLARTLSAPISRSVCPLEAVRMLEYSTQMNQMTKPMMDSVSNAGLDFGGSLVGVSI